jgi:hypothetical protein
MSILSQSLSDGNAFVWNYCVKSGCTYLERNASRRFLGADLPWSS